MIMLENTVEVSCRLPEPTLSIYGLLKQATLHCWDHQDHQSEGNESDKHQHKPDFVLFLPDANRKYIYQHSHLDADNGHRKDMIRYRHHNQYICRG